MRATLPHPCKNFETVRKRPWLAHSHALPRDRVTARDVCADHAGGDAAAFGGDPAAYEFAVAQYLGAGVAACYRGSRPYSLPTEQAMLTKWIGFYKAHRGSLIQPVVHIRRADMQSWDGWLHVGWLRVLDR